MDSLPVRFIVLSDIHLYNDASRELLGVNTRQSFQKIIDLVLEREKKMDFILVTGDLTQDYSTGAYLTAAEMLKAFNLPVYCIPGNHDDPKIMAQTYPLDNISLHRHIVLRDWHIVMLDSHKHRAVEGYLDDSQLSYLQHCLQAYPEHQALIVLHHHPVKMGSAWLDKIGLSNADQFWNILGQYPKVNTLLFGHVHQIYNQVINKVRCFSSPATCIQFMPRKETFGLENLPPGYRWIELYEDGRLETGIERAAEYVGEFINNAKGY
jgi:Icc protein